MTIVRCVPKTHTKIDTLKREREREIYPIQERNNTLPKVEDLENLSTFTWGKRTNGRVSGTLIEEIEHYDGFCDARAIQV